MYYWKLLTELNKDLQNKKRNKIFVKILFVVFLFIFFKNFVSKTKAKFVKKEMLQWSKQKVLGLHNLLELKLVKGCRCRSVQFNWGSRNAANYKLINLQFLFYVSSSTVFSFADLSTNGPLTTVSSATVPSITFSLPDNSTCGLQHVNQKNMNTGLNSFTTELLKI